MSSPEIALASAVFIFGGALVGLWLQARLPAKHLDKESHDAVKLGVGIIATLSALVMGLLVSSAKSTFDTLNAGIVKCSADFILLDRVLAHYGPEAAPIRLAMRDALISALNRIWPEQASSLPVLTAIERARNMENLQEQIRELVPHDDLQRQTLAEANQIVANIVETRWLLIEQAQNQLPLPFLFILVFWLSLIFLSFGLYAPRHATVVAVFLGSALSMAAAIFLILELNRPLHGMIKISSAPMRDALTQIGK